MFDYVQFLNIIAGQYEQTTSPATEVIIENDTEKYDADIKALSAHFSMNAGDEIVITLQELLEICPRKRRRSDAYKGLVAELGARGISLTIKKDKKR